MGVTRDKATQMTGEFMHVAGALTNFNSGTETAESVITKISAALTGELSGLKSLGIQLDADTVKRKAVEQGYAATTDAVDKEATALVVLNEMYSQSTDALAAYNEESLDAKTKLGLLKSQITDIGAEMFSNFLPIINEVLGAFKNKLEEWQPAIEKVSELFGRFTDGIMEGKGFLENLYDSFGMTFGEEGRLKITRFVETFGFLTFAIMGSVGAYKILKGLMAVTAFIDKARKSWLLYKGATKGATVAQWLLNGSLLANPITWIVILIAGLVAGIIYLWTTSDDFRAAIIYIWEAIKEKASEVWGAICDFFTETVPQAIDDMVAWFKELPSRMKEAFTEAYNNVKQWGSDTWESMKETASNCVNSVVTWFNELPHKIGYALGEVIGKIAKWGVDSWTHLQTNVPMWIEGVRKWFAELPSKIWTALVETYNKVVKWGSDTYNKMYDSAKECVDAVIKWFKEMPGKVWTWLVETVNKVINWKNDLVERGREAAQELVNTIVTKVKELPGEMLQAGKDLVEGLWNGITSMGSWLADKVGGFFSGIVDGVKGVFKINSPSKVFAEIGEWNVKGLVAGMENELPKAERVIETDMSRIIPSKDNSILNLEKADNNKSEQTFHIVQNFGSQINPFDVKRATERGLRGALA
ncbi:MAG: phage tail protein [Paraclostridium sp.]